MRQGPPTPYLTKPDTAMIPLRLNLRNFLCYRENVPELDFTGLHVACLCGSNGHGKSALLDAITWNLWCWTVSKSNPGFTFKRATAYCARR